MKVVLKKADEMEMAINLKAARYAFGFLEIAIMCYCIVERIITGVFPSPVFILGILGMLIYNGIKIYETRRMTDVVEEDEEYYQRTPEEHEIAAGRSGRNTRSHQTDDHRNRE